VKKRDSDASGESHREYPRLRRGESRGLHGGIKKNGLLLEKEVLGASASPRLKHGEKRRSPTEADPAKGRAQNGHIL